uniref:Uncharacterized protein n=1 Tax=Caudovirales sp. ct3EF15 TaxID=2826766 RepID=A0A8S5MML9_9CAUD|nr:MAG TPA: hypothetical protein [Caudovirales sp. ct3EF15]DAY45846.1 MAG TPA: hypothetical protein [Caudoviricetes sp.]
MYLLSFYSYTLKYYILVFPQHFLNLLQILVPQEQVLLDSPLVCF